MAAPTIRQSITNDTRFTNTSTWNGTTPTQFPGLCQATNAIVVFYTMSDFAGVHSNLQTLDTEGNTYAYLTQCNSNPSGGAQTVAALVAANIAGDTTVANSVTSYLGTNGDVEDYQANFIIEVANALASPVVGYSSQAQNALAPGTNNAVSGNIIVAANQVPCILLASCMNSSVNGSPALPTVGTNMTLLANCWGAINTIAYRNITAAGTYQGVFNQASNANEDMATAAVIIQGAASPNNAKIGWIHI